MQRATRVLGSVSSAGGTALTNESMCNPGSTQWVEMGSTCPRRRQVRSLVGRWTWKKGAKPEEKQQAAFEGHVVLELLGNKFGDIGVERSARSPALRCSS